MKQESVAATVVAALGRIACGLRAPAGPVVHEHHAVERGAPTSARVEIDMSAMEVWVQPYSGGDRVRVSPRGGIEPVWARSGREIYYLEGTKMMMVTVDTTSNFNFHPPVTLFDYAYRRAEQPPTYDVSADGRFLLIKPSADVPAPPSLSVITNWVQKVADAR